MSKEIIENNKLLIEIRKIVKEEVGTIVKEEVRTIVKEEVNVALKPLTIDVSKISQRLNKVEKSLNKGDFIDLDYIYPSDSKYNVIDDNITIPKSYNISGGDNKYTYDMINMRNNIKLT